MRARQQSTGMNFARTFFLKCSLFHCELCRLTVFTLCSLLLPLYLIHSLIYSEWYIFCSSNNTCSLVQANCQRTLQSGDNVCTVVESFLGVVFSLDLFVCLFVGLVRFARDFWCLCIVSFRFQFNTFSTCDTSFQLHFIQWNSIESVSCITIVIPAHNKLVYLCRCVCIYFNLLLFSPSLFLPFVLFIVRYLNMFDNRIYTYTLCIYCI